MIAGTGAEHHCFAPVLALFGLVKTAAKRRRGLRGKPPQWGRVMEIGNRKSACANAVWRQSPKRVWAAAHRNPKINEKGSSFRAECEAFSIETGSRAENPFQSAHQHRTHG